MVLAKVQLFLEIKSSIKDGMCRGDPDICPNCTLFRFNKLQGGKLPTPQITSKKIKKSPHSPQPYGHPIGHQ